MKKRYGFTLIEIIIVVAVVGVLTAIIVPTAINYMDRAKKKATMENGKTLWTEVNNIIVWDTDTYESFYTTKDNTSRWCFESNAEGVCQRMYLKENSKPKKEGNYILSVVCRVDGRWHKTGSGVNDEPPSVILNTWDDADYNNKNRKLFMTKLCASEALNPFQQNGVEFPLKMPYNKRDDGKKQPIVRWIICYRCDNHEDIEIWAGDGTNAKNGPVYRVYPNAAPIYMED